MVIMGHEMQGLEELAPRLKKGGFLVKFVSFVTSLV